jgi:hypothetical protein
LEVINLDREKAIREYCPSLKKQVSTKEKFATSSEEISEPEAELRDIIKNLDGV